MSKYKYESPLQRGYVKLSSKEAKEILKEFKVKKRWNEKLDLYRKDDIIYYQKLVPVYVKMLETLLVPLYVAVRVLHLAEELVIDLIEELTRLWFQKKTGAYTCGHINLTKSKEYL